jgi:hypothetical protein
VLTSLSKFESQTQILNSHSQSIAKLEVQLGQLAKSFNEREIGKCSSPPVANPRSGGVAIDPKVGETKTEPIGQLEKENLTRVRECLPKHHTPPQNSLRHILNLKCHIHYVSRILIGMGMKQ